MLTVYASGPGGLVRTEIDTPGAALPPQAVWIDLLSPTGDEERLVGDWLGIAIPTPEEMREIEVSSRLYEDGGALVMTALAMIDADTDRPRTCEITFILAGAHLVTVRHETPKPIPVFLQRMSRAGEGCRHADYVLGLLIDAFLDRIADILERAGGEAEAIGQRVFEQRSGKPMKTVDFRRLVTRIGRTGDLTSKARDSLLTFSRLITFLQSGAGAETRSKEARQTLKTAQRDADQLADHATYLGNKAEFLLDATIGLINIEQNNIIKIFSVVAVALMPPTLIASIYGMNFRQMPELDWPWAYPAVLAAMIAIGLLPYVFFRRKGWL